MKNQLKIIKLLIEHKEEQFSILQLAKQLNLNYKIAYGEIKKLDLKNLLIIKKLGNSKQCSFNCVYNELVLAAEKKRQENLLKNKNIKLIYHRLEEIKNPFYIFLIFGSYVKKTNQKNSDIDLCLISDNQELRENINQIIRTLALDIHLLVFSTNDFLSMLKTTENNVGKEIVKNNIILKGIENFYEMINYAR